MSVVTTWFRDGISSECLLNCKPVFCSTAHWLPAKETTQQPQHSPCHSAWVHTPYLEGGWVQGAWPCSPSLLPKRPSVLLSASVLHACTESVLDKIFHPNLLFLTHCHYFVHYATKKKIIISFLSGLISQSNLNGKTMCLSNHRTFSLSNF